MNKIWKPIQSALKYPSNYRRPIYFVGRTLVVDLKKGFVAMNQDGNGFTRAGKVVLPQEILPLVKETYIKTFSESL